MTLTIPEKHQLKVAKDSMRMHCPAIRIMGGPDHVDAVRIIDRLAGKAVPFPKGCNCQIRRLEITQ